MTPAKNSSQYKPTDRAAPLAARDNGTLAIDSCGRESSAELIYGRGTLQVNMLTSSPTRLAVNYF